MCAVAFAWVCLRLRVFAGRECLVGTLPARYFLYKSSDTIHVHAHVHVHVTCTCYMLIFSQWYDLHAYIYIMFCFCFFGSVGRVVVVAVGYTRACIHLNTTPEDSRQLGPKLPRTETKVG